MLCFLSTSVPANSTATADSDVGYAIGVVGFSLLLLCFAVLLAPVIILLVFNCLDPLDNLKRHLQRRVTAALEG